MIERLVGASRASARVILICRDTGGTRGDARRHDAERVAPRMHERRMRSWWWCPRVLTSRCMSCPRRWTTPSTAWWREPGPG